MPSKRPYHHGDLPAALIAGATEEIAAVGPSAMSVRKVAARAGVSHAAVAHHFGDKRGLLTAVAAAGHRALADALALARPSGMLALGESYLRFAHEHRAWFEVMFRPDLVRTDDPALAEATRSSFGELRSTASRREVDHLAYGAWALVHGITVLWLAGNLPVDTIEDATDFLRRSARALAVADRPRRST